MDNPTSVVCSQNSDVAIIGIFIVTNQVNFNTNLELSITDLLLTCTRN